MRVEWGRVILGGLISCRSHWVLHINNLRSGGIVLLCKKNIRTKMTCTLEDLAKISEIAGDEIGETGVDIVSVVRKVKEVLAEKYGDLQLPPDSDELLERSLRYRKFNVIEAATHLHLYFKFLHDLHAMHGDMHFLPSLRQPYFYDSLAMIPLKNRDAQGRVVILFNFERMPTENYDLDKAIASTLLVMDELTRVSVDTQRIGIVFLCNYKGYKFGHAKQYTFSRVGLLMRMFRGSFPVRYKGFHVVQAPALFTCTFAVLRPFLSEKLKGRIHFHGNELTEFHKHISPDILPDFLGGKLSYEESVDMDFVKQIVSKDEYYKDLFKTGYMREDGK